MKVLSPLEDEVEESRRSTVEALARLEGKMDSILSQQALAAGAFTTLDARVRESEKLIAAIEASARVHHKPPIWPSVLSAVVASIGSAITFAILIINTQKGA